MKKILIYILLISCLILSSCGNGKTEPVIATTPTETEKETEETSPTLAREAQDHIKTVIIDAGHGFGDVGCGGPDSKIGKYEYVLTEDMASALRDDLTAYGYKVYLTHDGNSFPSCSEIAALADRYGVEYDTTKDQWEENDIYSPYERVIYMNCIDAQYGADFSVSVHVNANADSEDLRGFDIDYCKENNYSGDSYEFVRALRSSLYDNYSGSSVYLYADSWDDSFVVTKYNTMPSMLFETGYSTNDTDAENLKNSAWRSALMQNLAKSIYSVLGNPE